MRDQAAWRITFSGHAVARPDYQCVRYGYDRRDPLRQGARHGASTTSKRQAELILCLCNGASIVATFVMRRYAARCLPGDLQLLELLLCLEDLVTWDQKLEFIDYVPVEVT